MRLRPTHANHVWSYDFVSAKTHDGRTPRMMNLIDESTRECLLNRPERRWTSAKVIEALADVMVMKGVSEHIRSDNGPEFVARGLRAWLADTGAKTLYIEPWENGYCESFNSKLRDEFLNGEIFYSMKELRVLGGRIFNTYNVADSVLESAWRACNNYQKPNTMVLGTTPEVDETSIFWAFLRETDATVFGDTSNAPASHSNITRQWAELAHWFPAVSRSAGLGAVEGVQDVDFSKYAENAANSHSYMHVSPFSKTWCGFKTYKNLMQLGAESKQCGD